jgi:GTPase SAR1 family protein
MAEQTVVTSLKIIWSLGDNLIDVFFRGTVSFFLAGAPGVGKTSFRLTLKNAPLEVKEQVTRTSLGERENIPYMVPANKSRIVPLKCYDFGGDAFYALARQDELKKIRPLGILFFIDHQDTRKELLSRLPPRPTRRQFEDHFYNNRDKLGRIKPSRMAEHQQSLNEIITILSENKKLREYCKVVVPVINKEDLWGDYYRLEHFQQYFAEQIVALRQLNIMLTQFVPCSTYRGEGIEEIMSLLLEHAGRELNLFNRFKVRVNLPFNK